MTARKKRGVGFLISGAVFAAMGGIFLGTEVTPDWVATVIGVVGLVANALGFVTVFPDTEG